MKNDLTKYMMKKNFKTNVIWSAIISAAVSLVFIILAVCIRGTADGEEELNNFATFIILFFSSFICSAGVCVVGINMSINMNRSRKTAVKAMFTTVIAAVVVCSGLALAAEVSIALVSNSTGFVYKFKPLFLSGNAEFGIDTVLISYCINVLLYYAVSVATMFIVCSTMKFGKWVWIGWWVIYMLLISAGKTIFRSVGGFAKDIFGSVGGAALAALIITAVAFTVADIMIIKKTELKKSALMWSNKAA